MGMMPVLLFARFMTPVMRWRCGAWVVSTEGAGRFEPPCWTRSKATQSAALQMAQTDSRPLHILRPLAKIPP